MTPDFALLLSEDGIVLLQRQPLAGGWVKLDRVPIDDSDLTAGLRRLADTGKSATDGAFSTLLVLPNSQLLYAEVAVSHSADADIRTALEDRTPYQADDLIYDTSGSGETKQIVAVARETLSEAIGFLSPFAFSPVGFTAIPPEGCFDGAPNLGGIDGSSFDVPAEAIKIVPPVAATPVDTATPAPVKQPSAPKVKAAEQKTAEPKLKAKETPKSNTAPAAFSSRRQGSVDASKDAADRVAQRAPRIALPTPSAPTPKRATPKLSAPSRAQASDSDKPTKIKTASDDKSVPPIIPAPIPEKDIAAKPAKSSKTFELARRLKKTKAAKATRKEEELPDPIAGFAAQQTPGKPRFLGAVLTLILIAALGLFAVLSSYLLPEGGVAGLFRDDTIEDVPVEIVSIEDEEASDLNAFELSSLPQDDLPAADILPDTLPTLDLEADNGLDVAPAAPSQTADSSLDFGPMSPAEAETSYAATGIWQRAPDFASIAQVDRLDDLYVASLDPNPAFQDAPALTLFGGMSPDTTMALPLAPPPPGVTFDIDERGLVRATSQGALSPQGVMVFAGTPPVVPLPRDADAVPSDIAMAVLDVQTQQETDLLLPAPQPDGNATADADTQTSPALDQPFADPALARFSPRQRPADLQSRVERALLGGRTRAELAAFRPGERPAAILEAARLAAIAAIDAAKQAQEDAIASAVEGLESEDIATQIASATASAIARSVKPASRPRNFQQVVASARARPQAPSAEVQTASASTASAAVRGSGPAVARTSRVRPSGPTTNSVARAATDNNAIALGKVSLVGVFGTASNRRALVRLPSGRFKKVSIGDRVDGGRVAAIGSAELRYTKSGRTHTLKMPKG